MRLLALIFAVTLLLRLLILLSPLGTPDADGAVSGLMAVQMAGRQHLWLVWAGQQYAGTVDTWFQALTMRILGVTETGVGLPMAVAGAATSALLAAGALHCWSSRRAALGVGLMTSAFPWWLVHWGTVWPGGYAVGAMLGVAALVLVLLRHPASGWDASLVGLLSGLAVWNQPLTVSLAGAAVALLALDNGWTARTARLLSYYLAGALTGLLPWAVGLRDGTQRDLGGVEALLTPKAVFSPEDVVVRLRLLSGPIGRSASGLAVTKTDLLVPAVLAQVLLLAMSLTLIGVLVSSGRKVLAARATDADRMTFSLSLVVALSAALFVLFPPAALGQDIPRYLFVGMLAASALLGAQARRLRRGGPAPVLGLVAVLLASALASSARSYYVLSHKGTAFFNSSARLSEMRGFSERLEREGISCLRGSYFQVYPLSLSTGGRLLAQATASNRLAQVCPEGIGTADVFPALGGPASPEELAYRAGHPGARRLDGVDVRAYLPG